MDINEIKAVVNDPSAPYWLKRLVVDVADKDPVDVLNCLQWLVEKYEEALERAV